MNSATYPWF